jgi:hypothetical protein
MIASGQVFDVVQARTCLARPMRGASACRASWVGDTDKLWRASDAAFAEHVGTDADYHHFKRVSGAAAVQRAIEKTRASLPRLDLAAPTGGAQGAAVQ